MYTEHEMKVVAFEDKEQFAGVLCGWSDQGEIVGPDSYGGDAPGADM